MTLWSPRCGHCRAVVASVRAGGTDAGPLTGPGLGASVFCVGCGKIVPIERATEWVRVG